MPYNIRVSFKNPEDRKKYHQDYYLAHKEEYISRARNREARQKELLRKTLREAKAKPCTDCNVEYPYYVMQFDHLSAKEFTIGSYAGTTGSVKRLLAEIAKCEVVCANCHAERTHQRRLAAKAVQCPQPVPLNTTPRGDLTVSCGHPSFHAHGISPREGPKPFDLFSPGEYCASGCREVEPCPPRPKRGMQPLTPHPGVTPRM